jgi:hypothetical protein
MLAALVATVSYVPLKSKVFHSFQFPPLPQDEPQDDVLGLLSPSPVPHADGFGLLSPAPHDEGFGSLSPVPQEAGFGLSSPSFEPQDEPQGEEVMSFVPEDM